MHKDAKTNRWRPRRHALQRCRCAQIRKCLPAWIPRARACGQRQCMDAGETRDEGTRAHICTGKATMHGTPHVNVHTCQQTKKKTSQRAHICMLGRRKHTVVCAHRQACSGNTRVGLGYSPLRALGITDAQCARQKRCFRQAAVASCPNSCKNLPDRVILRDKTNMVVHEHT